MDFYELKTELTFGKHIGRTLREVVEMEPSYLNWCILNEDMLYISAETLEIIRKINPKIPISEEAIVLLQERFKKYLEDKGRIQDYDYYPDYPDDNTSRTINDEYGNPYYDYLVECESQKSLEEMESDLGQVSQVLLKHVREITHQKDNNK